MDVNPYAAPPAPLEDLSGAGRDDLEARAAGRGPRLAPALLDGLRFVILIVPCAVGGIGSADRGGREVDSAPSSMLLPTLFCLLLCAIAVVNSIVLQRNGQTIGKRALGSRWGAAVAIASHWNAASACAWCRSIYSGGFR